MFRTGARAALRSHRASSLAPARTAGRRYLSTDPPHLKSRSWKNSAFRWGLAIAGIYYYNTSSVFAEYPQSNLLNPNVDAIDEERDHPTIDRLLESSRNKSQKDASILQTAIEANSEGAVEETQQNAQAVAESAQATSEAASTTSAAADLEAEAEGEGAFNPVTGEINWDCPCLGGMAYGPCGEEFRSAFSCFVYSTEEPKGMDCIEKFGAMQDCFRAHPEVYKGELEDDEALDGELAAEKEELRKEIEERREQVQTSQSQQRRLLDEPAAPTAQTPGGSSESQKNSKQTQLPSKSLDTPQPDAKTTTHIPSEDSQKETEHGAASQIVRQPKTKATDANAIPEANQLVPKSAHDATDATSGQSTLSTK